MSTTETTTNLPPERYNRPGLDAIAFRIGTHSSFYARMLARLALTEVPDNNGVPVRPLADLTTRDPGDATMALLDAWATALDVLTFYQERIANEGYLRTATERRSVLDLARAIGYELKPGVAAGTFLAFTVEEGEDAPSEVLVPAGTQILSVPTADELPQTFETSADILTRAEWNELRARTRAPQTIAGGTREVYLAGASTGLQSGDVLVIVGDERLGDPTSAVREIRVVTELRVNVEEDWTAVAWAEPLAAVPAQPRVYAFRQRASLFGHNAPEWRSLAPDQQQQFAELHLDSPGAGLAANGATFASGGSDQSVYVWTQAQNPAVPLKLTGHTAAVYAVAMSPDGSRVASGGADQSVKLWDALSGTEIPLSGGLLGSAVFELSFAPDGGQLAAGTDGGTITVWNILANTAVNNSHAHGSVGNPAAVTALRFFRQETAPGVFSTRLASGGSDGRLVIWNVSGGTLSVLAELSGQATITDLAVAPDGATVLFSTTQNRVGLWHYAAALDASNPLSFTVSGSAAQAVDFPPVTSALIAGWPEKFLVGLESGSLQEWVLKTDAGRVYPEVALFAGGGHDKAVRRAFYVGDNTHVFSAGDDNLRWWHAADRALERSYTVPLPANFPTEWPGFSNQVSRVDLDATYSKVLAPGWLALENPGQRELYRIVESSAVSRSDYLLSERVTRLQVDTDRKLSEFGLRETSVYAQSEELTLAATPIAVLDPVEGEIIDLARVVAGLEVGRRVIVNGRRARVRVRAGLSTVPQIVSEDRSQSVDLRAGDILEVRRSATVNALETVYYLRTEGGFIGTVTLGAAQPAIFDSIAAAADAVPVSEVAILKNIEQRQGYTRLALEAALAGSYDCTTVSVMANVTAATHGETITQVLGSGDGSARNQTFALGDGPLTFVSAPTESGIESTLEVRVNGVRWDERDSLYGAGPRDAIFVTRREDDGTTRVIFGDGESGERLPTGPANVTARYRKGLGRAGQVGAAMLRLLQTQPNGIREVINPVAASGAAEPEQMDAARERAPFSVLTLGRIVSLKDFQDFARSFGGIGKAFATSLWQNELQIVYLTVAGEGGAAVENSSDLYQNLVRAMDTVRDPFQPLRVASYQPLLFNVAAKLLIDPAYIAERVLEDAALTLRARFEFQNVAFGQDITAAEVVAALQNVPGVRAVDLDQLFLASSALFHLGAENTIAFEELLEHSTVIPPAVRTVLNAKLATLSGPPAALSAQALVYREKKGQRWVVAEPEAEDGYAILKERGLLNVYAYPGRVPSFLAAELARLEGEQFLPAQLLLLNPDPSGVVLMELKTS